MTGPPWAWLWPGRIPAGALSLVAGEPGSGLSTFLAWLAATVTTGGPWPDFPGDARTPGDVVWISGEESMARVVLPRLDAAGAALARVHFPAGLDDPVSSLAGVVGSLADVRLVVVDAAASFAGAGELVARPVVAALAGASPAPGGPAVVLSGHLRWTRSGHTGSHLLYASARFVVRLSADPADPGRRRLDVMKGDFPPGDGPAPPVSFGPDGGRLAPRVVRYP